MRFKISDRLRVIFMGTPDFAVPTLRALHAAGHEIVLVVSRPDTRSGRGKQMRSPPVIEAARELGLPTSQPRAIRSGSFPARIAALEADVAVVIAYGRILTQFLLDAPKLGCVNLHASLLPRWRGAAPIQAAILEGDARTGVCAQRMEADLDTGPIYVEESLALTGSSTGGWLHDTLSEMSARVAVETLQGLAARKPSAQDHALATFAPKLSKATGLVDWNKTAVEIDRRVRAMTPWPGGWVPWKKGPLKLAEVRLVPDVSGKPGTIVSTSPLQIATADGAVELVTVRAPGRKGVSGTDFANGARLAVGSVLAAPE